MLDWLKDILGESYTDDIEKKVADEIGKGFIARADFNAANEAKKGLEAQLADANKAIEDMKDSAGDAEKTAQAIADWEKKYKEDTERLKAENEGLKYTHNIEALSLKEKFTSEAARKAFVADLVAKKLPYEDGKLVGFDDFKKSYMETDPGAFAAADDSGDKSKTPAKVNTGGEHTENTGSDDPFVAGAMKGAGLNTGKDE